MRRRFIAGLLAACSLAAGSAGAQTYPSKQITLVVPFSAGGPTDTLARILAERMSRTLGQTVIVDNTTGAAGTIGVARVVRAAPDGYTIGIGHWSTHVVNPAIYPLTFDILTDLEPLADAFTVLADFVRDGIDIAIRYGAGDYEGVMSELLSEVDVFPVCSPELLGGEHPLRVEILS